MTGLERNADVVHLATYAPLFRPCGCLAVESGPYLVRQPPHDAHPELLRPADVWNECRYRRSPSADGRQAGGWARQLYATASLDAPTGEIILKLVNAGSTPAQVQVNFNGLRKRQLIGGSCTYLQNCDWRTVNTLEQEALVPRIRRCKSARNPSTWSCSPVHSASTACIDIPFRKVEGDGIQLVFPPLSGA